MAETIRYTLRNLVLQHGFTAVHKDFLEMAMQLRADLDGMQTPGVPVEVAEVKPIRVVKTTKEVMKNLVVLPPPSTPVSRAAETKTVDEQLSKLTIHKLTIDKRVGELKAQGISAPFPALTMENLKTWIETDGMTYWKIAEMTGAQDQLVSSLAKMYGLQSNASKMIMFKKTQQ